MWVQLSHVELVSPPTGKYRPTLQMGMLGLNEIKGLSWRSELEVGRIGAWIQIWDGLSQPSTCTLGERRKTMTWWGKKAAQMKLNFFFFFFYLNKRFNVFILHSRIPISLKSWDRTVKQIFGGYVSTWGCLFWWSTGNTTVLVYTMTLESMW